MTARRTRPGSARRAVRRAVPAGLLGLAALLALLGSACPHGQAPTVMPRLPGEDDPAARPDAAPAAGPTAADPWKGRTDLIQAPPAAPPAPVALPPVERFVLPNGLQVLVVENHDLPLASFHLALDAGEIDEPRDRRSLATFAAAMLTKGTKRRSADRLAEAIDFVGGSIGAATDLEGTHVTCDVLSKDLETCLTLLPEIVVEPSFPEKEMGETRDRLLTAVRQVRDDAGTLASEHFENLLWGEDHPRGWPVTEETVNAVSRADLVAWHKARFRPTGALLAVAGDVDAKALRARLTKAFGGWRKGQAPPSTAAAEPAMKGVRVRLVDKPDQTQSHLLVGSLGIAHGDPDYFPVVVMNYTLGGGAFSSRLMKVVRSEGGKTYGASSSFERWRRRGEFRARTFTRNAETIATLRLVLGEIARMRDAGPTEAELADARANLAGNYPLGFQSASDVARAVLSAERHGLGIEYVRDFALRVGAVSVDDARRAARQRLDPANMVVVIVGRAADVAPQLEKAGIPYEQVGHLEPISARDRARAAAARRAPIDPAATAEGKRLLDQALEARGGRARLEGIGDILSRGKLKVSLGPQSLEGTFTRVLAPPDRLRLEVKVPGGVWVTVTSPGAVWQAVGPRTQVLPPEQAALERAALWRLHDTILLHHLAPETVVQARGREKVGGAEYDVVTLRREGAAGEVTILLDRGTHQIFRVVYESEGRRIVEEFRDYRDVSGMKYPYSQRTERGDETLLITLEDVKLNAGVPEKAFEKP